MSQFSGLGSFQRGKLIAICNPTARVSEETGELVLQISNQQQLYIIGTVKTYSVCAGIKKDGKQCSLLINSSVGKFCQYHSLSKSVNHVPNKSKVIDAAARNASNDRNDSNISSNSNSKLTPNLVSPDSVTSSAAAGDLLDEILGKRGRDSSDKESAVKRQRLLLSESKDVVAPVSSIGDDDEHVHVERSDVIKHGSVVVPRESILFRQGTVTPLLSKQEKNSILASNMRAIQTPVPSVLQTQSKQNLESKDKLNNDVIISCGRDLLVNKTKLLTNAKNFSISRDTSASSDNKIKSIESKRNSLIDELLSKKSAHAAEEEQEWFEGYEKRLSKMIWKESKMNESNESKAVSVKAFQCHQCSTILETANPLCRQKNHLITLITTTKRFFECKKCRRREHTLGTQLLPERACGFCGSFDFISTGKFGSGESSSRRTGVMGERLVTGRTEWTSFSDAMQLSHASSKLDP
jgi:hypothetical protein